MQPGQRSMPGVWWGNGFVDPTRVSSERHAFPRRCKSCRTYVNPFVHWESNGRRWRCNLCGESQTTTDSYVNSLDETGKRVDRYQRHELHKGAVEYIAPGRTLRRSP